MMTPFFAQLSPAELNSHFHIEIARNHLKGTLENNTLTIISCVQGNIRLCCDQKAWQLSGHSAAILPPGTCWNIRPSNQAREYTTTVIIRISAALIDRISASADMCSSVAAAAFSSSPDGISLSPAWQLLPPGAPETEAAQRALAELCHRLAVDMIKNKSLTPIRTYMYFFQIMDALQPLICFSKPEGWDALPKPVQKALHFIQNNWRQELTLHQLARSVKMSDASLSRAIKKYTGVHFEVYLKNIRLSAAKKALTETSRKVTDIALDHGFSSAPAFNRAFRDAFHMTPGQYRRQQPPLADTVFAPKTLPLDTPLHKIQPQPQSPTVVLSADASEPGTPADWASVPWLMAVNMGMASDFKQRKFRAFFEKLVNACHFTYARIYNIFSPDMDYRSGHDTKHLNFDQLDELFDLILQNGLLPMIELAAKPRIVKKNIYEDLLYEDKDIFFLDLDEELQILEAFFLHLKHRYGAGIQQWLFEYWYDYSHLPDPDTEIYHFQEKYERIAHCLKSIIPKAKIGGCGLALIDFDIDSILKAWSALPTPPDFLSFSYFPYSGRDLSLAPHWMTSWITGTAHINSTCSQVKALSKKYFGHELPVYITEWNMSLSNCNFFNDSCHKAALLVHYMLSLSDSVDMAAYYMGNDLTARTYDQAPTLSGASGLMTRNGIFKPVFYAMQFTALPSGSRLLKRTSGSQIAAVENGFFHYPKPSGTIYRGHLGLSRKQHQRHTSGHSFYPGSCRGL